MIIHTLAVKNTEDWGNFEDYQVGIIQGELDTMDIETLIELESDGSYTAEIVDCEEQELIITIMSGNVQEIVDCLSSQFESERELNEMVSLKPVFTLKKISLAKAVVEIDWAVVV